MVSAVSSATVLVSGLRAQTGRVNQAANNIVNQNTPDYQAERGSFVSQGTGNGVSYVRLQAEGGGVDLDSEIVSMLQATNAYEAAASSFAAITRTETRVLNTLA